MIPFRKMHGAGNDFVVLDARERTLPVLDWQKLADRHFGVGCDQIVILGASNHADVFMRIINADGSEVASCGNASRCVGHLLAEEQTKQLYSIETLAGVIYATTRGDGEITIDMGEPRLTWEQIPLSHECDVLHLPISHYELQDPVAVSMGNPHVIFFVNDVHAIPLEKYGELLEHNRLFPERANISIARVRDNTQIDLRVWERGSGITLACGTAACATLVAAHLRGLIGRNANIALPGGVLAIEWKEENNHVLMTGPVATSFTGHLDAKEYQV